MKRPLDYLPWRPVSIRLIGALLSLNLFSPALLAETLDASERQALEQRVQQLSVLDEGTRRMHLSDVFLLADLYAAEGRAEEALRLYQEALKLDGWRLEYQLKLAQLLLVKGNSAEAIEKLKFVYQYSEDAAETDTTEKLLKGLGAEPPEVPRPTHPAAPSQDFSIVLVPIGPVNGRLLEAARERLQHETGISYSIAPVGLKHGEPDRTQAEFLLEMIIGSLKDSLPYQKFYELLSKYNLTEDKAKTKEGIAQLLTGLAKEQGILPEQAQEFSRLLGQLEGEGQYNAGRLMAVLRQDYPLDEQKKVRGCIGVTGFDLFDSSSFSLMGQVSEGYGIISYRHLLGSSNREPPSRQRLLGRFVKSALQGSFAILGIPGDCPTPTCARSASGGVAGLDQVETRLCGWCLDHLGVSSASVSPNSRQVQQAVRRGYELLGKGQSQDAMEAYQEAVALDPGNVDAQVLLARIYKADSRVQEAMALYQELLERHPKNLDVATRFLLFCSDYVWWPYGDDEKVAVREGMRVGEKVYKTQPHSPDFLEAYGWFCYRAEDFERAMAVLQESLVYQRNPPRLYILSTVASHLGQWAVALAAYQEGMRLERGRQETEREKGLRELAESSLQGAQVKR